MRVLKLMGKLLLALTAFCIVLAALVWMRPALFLNEGNVKSVLHLASKGLQVSWRRFDWQFEAEGLLKKRSTLVIDGLCLRYGKTIDSCVNHLEFEFSVAWSGPHLRIREIPKLVVQGQYFTYSSAATEPGEATLLPDLRPPAFAEVFPVELRMELVRVVDISMPKIELRAGDKVSKGSLRVRKANNGTHEIALLAQASLKQGKSNVLNLDSKIKIHRESMAATVDAEGNWSGWAFEIPLSFLWEEKWDFEAALDLKKRQRFKTKFHAEWSEEYLKVDTDSFAMTTVFAGWRFMARDCGLESRFDQGEGYPKKNTLHCIFDGVTVNPRAIVKKVTIKAETELSLASLNDDKVSLDFNLKADSQDVLFDVVIETKGRLNYDLLKMEIIDVDKPSCSVKIGAKEFGHWVAVLKGTRFAVPAPFSSLRGPIKLDGALKNGSLQKELEFHATLETDFKNGMQTFLSKVEANITVLKPLQEKQRSFIVDVDATLRDIRIEAPRLKIANPPQLVRDRRFKASKAAAKKEAGLPIEWSVRLKTEQPIRIFSNLFAVPVPIALDLRLAKAKSISGLLEVQSMPLEILKRKISLVSIKTRFERGSELGQLDGLLTYRNSEVLVRILIMGNTKEPRIEFESDPPLGRQQIVALLLFNKPLHELTEEEASSAGNTSRAMTEGALGIFSLLLLSSTPIESVSYDPVTETYSAQMRIGNKTTVSLGSNFVEQRSLTFRRRLGGQWAIRTELQSDETSGNAVLTLLEWFRRF